MKAYFDQTPFAYSPELSLHTAKYSRRSCTHTRSSSETTVVSPDYMSHYSVVTIAAAAAAPADSTLPCMPVRAAASAHAMPLSSLKAHLGAPSPMSIPAENTSSIPSDHSARRRLRRDSLLCEMVSDNESDDEGNDDDDDYLLPTPVSELEDRDDECLFDMDADRSQYPSMPQTLDPKSLSYRHMGKPEPWAVRPTELFNAHRAQVRAIDDDDNEFYL
ncbi:hypothetical protein GGI09_005578 [Coemansia sp. S100]|nr:hypothetical protein LPJ71_001543 [Coemansia sp. S17]KAJ2094131.1 hypothetical protein GGI09_005578 [Coemansia sp. S100]